MVYLGVRKRKTNEMIQVTTLVQAKLEAKVAKTTAMLSGAVLVTFVLGGVLVFLGDVFPVSRFNSAFRVSITLLQLNSVVNPILYCYRDRRFRNAVLELLRLKKPQPLQVRKPRPIPQPKVGAAQVRRRKDQSGSAANVQLEPQTEKNPVTRPTSLRSSSCDPNSAFVDHAHRHPHEMTLKRSTSAPLLVDNTTVLDGCSQLPLEQHASVVVTSAVIHSERNMRYRERKFSNPESFRWDVHNSESTTRETPRSKLGIQMPRGLVKDQKRRQAPQLTRLIWM